MGIRSSLFAIIGGIVVLQGGFSSVCAQDECTEARPGGFRVLSTRDPWPAPWALGGGATGTVPLRLLDHTSKHMPRSISVRLDDGTVGTLEAIQRRCAPGEDCSPYDCGCTGGNESYWIEIRRRNGSLVTRKHLWAAYDRFQIVPVDLIDGLGDELLIARIPAHASPPVGWDLKIWRIGRQIDEIGGMPHLTRALGSLPFSCAWWQAMLTVDARAAKPRAISVRTEFGVSGCCRVDARAAHLADLRRLHTLQFDTTQQQYVMTGPAPSAFLADQ